MFPIPEESLEDAIVAVLAERPRLSVPVLRKAIARKHRTFTVQAIYKHLRELLAKGVVSKDRDRYSLQIGWVIEAASVVDKMYDRYVDRDLLEELLPPPKKKRKWHFYNLNRLVPFWTQLLLGLARGLEQGPIFEYAPHVWFPLANSQHELQFLRALEISGESYYLAVLGDAFLDRSYRRVFSLLEGEISFGQSPFSDKRGDYLSVVGDHVITVRLDKQLTESITRLFASVSSARDYDFGEVTALVAKRGRVTLILENNPEKARKLRSKFADFFGVVL